MLRQEEDDAYEDGWNQLARLLDKMLYSLWKFKNVQENGEYTG